MNSDNPASFGGCNPQKGVWHVYILLCSDNTHYTGCTSNIEERFDRHSKGQVEYTKSRLPVKLLFYATFTDKYKAYSFEKYLNPLYSYLSAAKGMNVRWTVNCKAGNPDLGLPKFGKC